jgi:apolipoprotein N-acyltransferase
MRTFFRKLIPPLPLVFPSVVSGVLVTLCFPVVSWWWLSFIALVPLLVAVLRHRPTRAGAFRAGFLMGLSCYFSMLWWIAKLIPAADVTIPWLMTPALILLVLYLALYPAFFLLLLRALSNWRYVAVFLSAPAVWALFELARSRGELAFPWGLLGYTLTDVPQLTQVASITGVAGVSFLIVLTNVLISGVIAARRASGRVLSGASLIILAMGWWFSTHRQVKPTRSSRWGSFNQTSTSQ